MLLILISQYQAKHIERNLSFGGFWTCSVLPDHWRPTAATYGPQANIEALAAAYHGYPAIPTHAIVIDGHPTIIHPLAAGINQQPAIQVPAVVFNSHQAIRALFMVIHEQPAIIRANAAN